MTPRYDPTGETDRLRADMEHAQTKAAVARADADALVAKLTPLRAVAFAAGSVLDEFGCLGPEIQTCREREVAEGEMCAVCLLELALEAWTATEARRG